jgi:thermitase
METPSLLNCVVILFLGTAAAQPASTPTSSTQTVGVSGSPGSIRAGHILVRFKTTPGQDVINQLNTAFGAKVVGRIDKIGVTHLQAPPEAGLALLGHLRNRRDVEFAEFDSPVQAIQSFVPDDIYYSTAYASSHHGNIAQWGPQAVSAPAAWGVTRGDSSIVIAIVDTGVDDTHPDLASKIVGEYSYVGKSAKDGFGHGTHCAGIAAADTNNVVGIAGMCPNCGILSVKVLDDQGSGFVSDVASGITYAASHGARVISLSLGGSGHTETLHSALDYAIANNALPVCAMGNNGSSSNTPEPGYWHDCLSVIATDQTGAKASFSNYGAIADVAAPGVAILSTMPTYPVTLTTAHGYFMNYDALSGTSMATPMVAGVAGLMLSQNPSLHPRGWLGLSRLRPATALAGRPTWHSESSTLLRLSQAPWSRWVARLSPIWSRQVKVQLFPVW